jgi:FtsP/CotA-like multicopper oxidase with cupredoxin domain
MCANWSKTVKSGLSTVSPICRRNRCSVPLFSVRRDTALFARGEQGSMRFIADNPGKWLIHCHMVEHMAGGMVTWFEVV